MKPNILLIAGAFIASSPGFALDLGGALKGGTDAASGILQQQINEDRRMRAEQRAYQREVERITRQAEIDRQRDEAFYVRQEQERLAIQAERRRLAEERQRLEKQAEINKVERVHPGWQELIKTPKFRTWFDKQPIGMRALGDSGKAEDAITVIDTYKKVPNVKRAP